MSSLLITGGAGFIGTEISMRLKDDPAYDRIVIFSRDWHKQSALREKLGNPTKFRWFIGDIRDKDRLLFAFNGIDHIIHAAALKDAITGAYDPREVLLNNGNGTQNVIEAAIQSDVKKVVFISSDKACQAESIYGAMKAAGEHLTVAANAYSPHGTRFASIRYGNVLGSSGSVLGVFKRQASTGILTITHEAMTRYWFEPKLAVNFILVCLEEMQGGEVFVPKLPASKIVDLARAVAPEAELRITAIRAGEKIHEVMISPTESHRTDDIGWGYRIKPTYSSTHQSYAGGSPVPWDWTYSSASATRLTVEQLRGMIG